MESSLKKIFVKITIISVFIIVVFLLIIFRIFSLQFKKPIDNNNLKAIAPQRGSIYSSDGKLLASSVLRYSLSIDLNTATLKKLRKENDVMFNNYVDSLKIVLKEVFSEKEYKFCEAKINKQIKNPLAPNDSIAGNLTIYQKNKISEFKERYGTKKNNISKYSINFKSYYKREYPCSKYGNRTIGKCLGVQEIINTKFGGISMTDSIKLMKGFSGLEKVYNDTLKGTVGFAFHKKIPTGNGSEWYPEEILIEPKNGIDVYSTINTFFQNIAEYALEKQLRKDDAKWGTVVIMEVKTGKIRAIANLEKQYVVQKKDTIIKYLETRNFAAGGTNDDKFPDPGSTFKLASMIVALDAGVKTDKIINTGNGKAEFYGNIVTDTKEGGYGKISVQKVFEVSSNIGVTRIIKDEFEKNKQQFIDGLYKLNLNTQLDVDIPGMVVPYIKNENSKNENSKSDWVVSSYINIAIGYEMKMPPLQLLTLYNAVANDGKMVKPLLVDSLVNNGKTIKRTKTATLNNKICSEKTLKEIKIMLEGVVLRGTARGIKPQHEHIYKIAGKTGTSQTNYTDRYKDENVKLKYYCSFIGYFPADNPQYTCLVGIYNPERGTMQGAGTATPVFKYIADKIIYSNPNFYKADSSHLARILPSAKIGYISAISNIYKQFDIQEIKTEFGWGIPRISNQKLTFKKLNTDNGTIIPDVRGMCVNDAIVLLEELGLNVEISGCGIVKLQSIKYGTKVVKGQTIKLKLAL